MKIAAAVTILLVFCSITYACEGLKGDGSSSQGADIENKNSDPYNLDEKRECIHSRSENLNDESFDSNRENNKSFTEAVREYSVIIGALAGTICLIILISSLI